MTFEEYQFASPFYALSIALRDKILKAPLGLVFNAEELSLEWKDLHLGAFNAKGELCACLVLSPLGKHKIKMRQVAVNDEVQGMGIGTSLVKYAEEEAKRRGYSEMVLSARIPAVIFYERMDYNIVGDEFVEVGIPHFNMKKQLII